MIQEYVGNSGAGDSGDAIRLKGGAGSIYSVRFIKNGNDLRVSWIDANGKETDSMTVEKHYDTGTASAKIEKIEAGNKVLLETKLSSLINEMSLFQQGSSSYSNVKDIYDHYWQVATPS